MTTADPKRPKQSHTVRNIIIISMVVLLVVLYVLSQSCSAGASRSKSGPGSGKTFTYDNYAELATDPDSFRGASVDVEGRLLKNPEVKGKETVFQMFADPKNSEWNTVVHVDSSSVPSGLARGDMAQVKGKVRGSFEGKNAFGATIKAVEVDADSVTVSNNAAAATLTPKTIIKKP